MSAAHTPGPWIVCALDGEEPDSANTIFATFQLENDRIEADVWDNDIARVGVGHQNFKENARLIAAAPDLLAALIEVVAGDKEAIEEAQLLGVPFPDEMLATYGKACAAIAKATGSAA